MKFSKKIKIILENPVIFNLFEKFMGVSRPRKKFINNYVCPKRNDKILDLGCGTGELITYLPSNIEYLGLDNNPNYIKSAKKKYSEYGEFQCVGVEENTSFIKKNYFDIVMSAGVIHHINDEVALELIKKAYYALKPGGTFVSFDPVLVENQNFISRFLIKNDRGEFVRTKEQYKRLISEIYKEYETFHMNNLHYFPYDLFIMKGIKPIHVD